MEGDTAESPRAPSSLVFASPVSPAPIDTTELDRASSQPDQLLGSETDAEMADDMLLEAPPSVNLKIHDDTILCTCPPGTKRSAKDIHFTGVKDGQPKWIHIPCSSQDTISSKSIKIPGELAAAGGIKFNEQAGKILMKALRNPNAAQKVIIKNFTSKFQCDGPCRGAKNTKEYFICKKCFGWQHKPCMLYGEEGDVGGPVCNDCFMTFMSRRDEVVQWQRKRLLQAVQHAWNWLPKPANQERFEQWTQVHEFVSKFFYHNQGVLAKFVAARRPPPLDMPPEEQMLGDENGEEDIEMLDDEDRQEEASMPRRRLKLKPRRPSLPPEDEGDFRDIGIEAPRRTVEPKEEPEDSGDEIVVTRTLKIKNVTRPESPIMIKKEIKEESPDSKAPPKPRARPKKASKRKRNNSASPAPAPLSAPPFSSAPRKSVRPKKTRTSLDMSTLLRFGNRDEEDEPESPPPQKAGPKSAQKNPHIKGPDERTSCKCPDSEFKVPPQKDCIACRECPLRQHKACAEDIDDGMPELCNFCYKMSDKNQESQAPPARRLKTKTKTRIKKKPSASTSAQASSTTQATPAPTISAADIPDAILALCPTVFWREYWALPTQPDFPDGRDPDNAPPFAPFGWLTELQQRLHAFITTVDPTRLAEAMQGPLSTYPRNPAAILSALRDLITEEMYGGAYRGRRKELGLLKEIVGLDDKGDNFDVPPGA